MKPCYFCQTPGAKMNAVHWTGALAGNLDHLEALARAATPGPWEDGEWDWAVVVSGYGNAPGHCVECKGGGVPEWVGWWSTMGEQTLMHRHRNHRDPAVPVHHVASRFGPITGNYYYDEGGILRPEDAAYIAAVSPDVVLGLLERLRVLEHKSHTGWSGDGDIE